MTDTPPEVHEPYDSPGPEEIRRQAVAEMAAEYARAGETGKRLLDVAMRMDDPVRLSDRLSEAMHGIEDRELDLLAPLFTALQLLCHAEQLVRPPAPGRPALSAREVVDQAEQLLDQVLGLHIEALSYRLDRLSPPPDAPAPEGGEA